jgi:4-diphosphocytidyl-2-C-methyl-D-erythritol kinase
MELRSYAKINLGLEIVGKRPDGYHNLKTIFQTIDLYDTIEIAENHTGQLNLSGDDPAVAWDQSNTIHKAVDALYDAFKDHENCRLHRGFDIHVKKKIPGGTGLGGGSSNAAVCLLYLVEHFQLDISREEIIRLASEIGADVPFFLVGGTVLAEGIGEKMTPLEDLENLRLDVVLPGITVPTGLIFSQLSLTTKTIKSKIETFLESKALTILENDLEKVTFEHFPQVGMVKNRMMTMDYDLVLMSGSGSAVFGVYRKPQAGEVECSVSGLADEFSGASVITTGSIGRNKYFKRIGASPSGKAPVFGAGIRRFESSRPSY